MIYLKCRVIEEENQRERERVNLPSAGSFPKLPQQAELDQAKGRNQLLHPSISYGCWGPSTWVIICCCFPRHISKELDWKGQPGLPVCASMVYQPHSRWLYPLCHNTSSTYLFIYFVDIPHFIHLTSGGYLDCVLNYFGCVCI